MYKLAISDVDAYMREAMAASIEEDEVAALEFGLVDGFAQASHFFGLPGKLQTQRFFCCIADKTATVEPLIRCVATKAVFDAEVVECRTGQTAGMGAVDLIVRGKVGA
jgi:hypothetical protein